MSSRRLGSDVSVNSYQKLSSNGRFQPPSKSLAPTQLGLCRAMAQEFEERFSFWVIFKIILRVRSNHLFVCLSKENLWRLFCLPWKIILQISKNLDVLSRKSLTILQFWRQNLLQSNLKIVSEFKKCLVLFLFLIKMLFNLVLNFSVKELLSKQFSELSRIFTTNKESSDNISVMNLVKEVELTWTTSPTFL